MSPISVTGLNIRATRSPLAKAVLTAALCVAAGSASAQSVYLHASAGAAYHALDCRRSVNCDRSDVGYRIGGGYRIARNWAAEVNYVDFGEATVNSSAGATTRLRTSGLGIGGAFISPPESRLTWAARVGVMAMNSDASGANASSHHHAPLYVGGSIGYRLTPNLAVELSATQSLTKADIAGVRENKGVAVLTAGVTVSF